MELFSKKYLSDYTKSKFMSMEKEIQDITDEIITSCDLDEWADYYNTKYYIDPIALFEEYMDNCMSETKIVVNNTLYGYGMGKDQVDGYCISYTIPFDGDVNLLYLIPSQRIMSHFPVSKVIEPCGEEYGFIEITIEKTRSDLKSHLNNLQYYVTKLYKDVISNYKQMIKFVNTEVDGYNRKLRQKAMVLLQERKEKAIDFRMISNILKIPMKPNENAPLITRLPLKRVEKHSPVKPNNRDIITEYCISDEDYSNIINIIHSACSSMEATARTFSKIDEEELRDFIIATLSTHYGKSVSGETFRKTGKTDIHVIFENKAAFIGECKIWHGIKHFSKAIDQLFAYSTWRDYKTALIIFNKERKDFNSLCNTLEKWIGENTKQYKKQDRNMWECIIYREDTNADIKLAIAVYDLTVNQMEENKTTN